MTHQALENLNIDSFDRMPSPEEIHAALPVPDAVAETVAAGRRDLQRILTREDPRLMVVVGPCSIHDPVAGLDYAERLKALSDEVSDTLLLVMRVYFEKPRTAVGWKGFINDPRMDDSFHIEEGVRKAREFLLRIGEIGLPAATEALDPITPQYLGRSHRLDGHRRPDFRIPDPPGDVQRPLHARSASRTPRTAIWARP